MADALDPEPGRYRRYRATLRPPWRRRADAQAGLAALRALNAGDGSAGPSRRFGRRRRTRPTRPRWLRALRWALLALAGWIGVSLVLFVISSMTAQGIPGSAAAALESGGLPPLSASNILVLGSDARPVGSKEPGANVGGPSRSDVMMLVRTGGGHSARLSIPRDTLVAIPGHGLAKINAAYYYGGPALAIRTVESFLRHQGQSRRADQLHQLPQARRRDGRRHLHRQLRGLIHQRRLPRGRLHAAAAVGDPPPQRRCRRWRSRGPARTTATRARTTSRASCANRSCCST